MTLPKDLVNKESQHNLQILSNVANEITRTYAKEMRDIFKFPQAWLDVTGEITDIYVQEMQNILEFSQSLSQRIKSFNRARKRLKL